MNRLLLSLMLPLLLAVPLNPAFAEEVGNDIETLTPNGDKVILHPNGRWEFVDSGNASKAAAIAKTYPENQGCPPGYQGGLMGFGRCIPPGDKDFNRGSLSGK